MREEANIQFVNTDLFWGNIVFPGVNFLKEFLTWDFI